MAQWEETMGSGFSHRALPLAHSEASPTCFRRCVFCAKRNHILFNCDPEKQLLVGSYGWFNFLEIVTTFVWIHHLLIAYILFLTQYKVQGKKYWVFVLQHLVTKQTYNWQCWESGERLNILSSKNSYHVVITKRQLEFLQCWLWPCVLWNKI